MVVYEALTGSKPYQGDAIYQWPKGLYPPKPETLSNKQWKALRKGLSYQRKDRTRDPRELMAGIVAQGALKSWRAVGALMFLAAVALGGYLQWGPESASAPESPPVVDRSLPQPPSRERVAAPEAGRVAEEERQKREQDARQQKEREAELSRRKA